MIIARRLLLDRRHAMMWWSIGIFAVVAAVVGMFPSIEGKAGLDKVFDKLPAALKAIAGVKDGISTVSPEGFLHGKLFAMFAPMLLTIFGIGLGAAAIAGAETDGTLELLLANPLTRRRLVVERYVVLVGLIVALGAVLALSVIALSPLIGGGLSRVPATKLIAASLSSVCLALLFASLAFAAGCITGKRNVAVAAATVVAVGGYLLHVLTATVSSLNWLGAVSPWRWYLRELILVDGLNALAVLLPLSLSAVAMLAGMAVFLRRDIR